MDFHLKQWRNQHESEEQHSTKMPKLLPESHQQQQPSASALPLFVPEPNSSKVSTLSDSTLASATMTSTTTNRLFPRMGSYFSLSQWQELELQALIFRYMLAGAAVPPELLQPIKKSLLHSPHYYLHHPLQHYQPSAFGSLGPGASSSSICSPPLASASFKSPFDLHLDERSSGTKNEDEDHVGGDGRSGGGGGHMLRHFFDDWPRSLQDSDNVENNAAAGRSLSISMPGASSDVSLKLSTGYGEDSGPGNENVSLEPEQLQLNWAGGWASSNQVASMGGPLAEALRSSTSTSSPTSVLHRHLPRGSETSFIST
ncbi:hypothetical protein JHK85_008169 [Glycine max]|nr:hypothetical protein JHK85_008169 [Glycine max]